MRSCSTVSRGYSTSPRLFDGGGPFLCRQPEQHAAKNLTTPNLLREPAGRGQGEQPRASFNTSSEQTSLKSGAEGEGTWTGPTCPQRETTVKAQSDTKEVGLKHQPLTTNNSIETGQTSTDARRGSTRACRCDIQKRSTLTCTATVTLTEEDSEMSNVYNCVKWWECCGVVSLFLLGPCSSAPVQTFNTT